MPHLTVRLRAAFLAAFAVALSASSSAPGQPAAGFLRKPSDESVRVLTWNVYRNSIFPEAGRIVDVTQANRPAQFARVLRALQPDVVCLQEVTEPAERSGALVDEILPQSAGRKWQAHAAADTVIVSRFALGSRGSGVVGEGEFKRGHAIAVVDAPAFDLYALCAHFQSSDSSENITLRLRHAELIATTIREAKGDTADVRLTRRMPFVILGDLNAIPSADDFLATLAAASRAGQRTGLDWDGTALTDALPRHNGSRQERYTWRNDLDRFPPSALDRIFYSDSVLTSVNQFVLDTTVMSYDALAGSGLRLIDVMRDAQAGLQDHYPLVIDLALRKSRAVPRR